MTMDQDRLKEFDKAPAETEDTECSWTEWNPESGQYEPLRRTKPLVPHLSREEYLKAFEGVQVKTFWQEMEDQGTNRWEPSPRLSDQSADTGDK